MKRFGCVVLLLTAGIALAAAVVTVERQATLRTGPGAWFPMVAVLERGGEVALESETEGWVAVRTASTNGWISSRALSAPVEGVDYSGLLSVSGVSPVSAVDIAAATKGLFATAYAQRHAVDSTVAVALDDLTVSPAAVALLNQPLTARRDRRLLQRLPRRPFQNTVILGHTAERALGHAMVAHLAADGLAGSEALVRYLNGVAKLVGARSERYDTDYRVGVLEGDDSNGFGLPGGYILLSLGYLRRLENEAELACVIGHEIAHSSLYHGLREFKKREVHRRRDEVFAELERISSDPAHGEVEAELNRLADMAYLKIIGGRAREDEFEADLFGCAYAAAAGYDPMAMVAMLKRLGDAASRDAFRHHPPPAERIEALEKAIVRYRLRRPEQQRLTERFRGVMARESGASEAQVE